MTSYLLRSAALMLALYTGAVLLAFAIAMLRSALQARRTRLSAAIRPAIQESLLTCLAGGSDISTLRRFAKTNRTELETALLAFETTVRGESRDRLWKLALDLGLTHQWCQEAQSKDAGRRRNAFARLAVVATYEPSLRLSNEILLAGLDHPDQETRREAARALAHSGVIGRTSRLFRFCVSDSPLTRILLAEDLRPLAFPLCADVLPEALRSNDTEFVLGALQVLLSWERALPLEDIGPVAEHKDPVIRTHAMRLLALLPASPANVQRVLQGLAESDTGVRAAAAASAGRLRLDAAMPALARFVRLGPSEIATVAADALAAMPPRGWQALEEFSAYTDPVTAFIARAALERAQKAAQA